CAASLPPRDSGEGGPHEVRWEGRQHRRGVTVNVLRHFEPRAPSTTLRVVPLPRYRGGGKVSSFSRCAFASELWQVRSREARNLGAKKKQGWCLPWFFA